MAAVLLLLLLLRWWESNTQEVTIWVSREGEMGRGEGGVLGSGSVFVDIKRVLKKCVQLSIKVSQDYSKHVFNSKTGTLHHGRSQLGGGASTAPEQRMKE